MSLEIEDIRKNLQRRSQEERNKREELRLKLLEEVRLTLKDFLSQYPDSKGYLFGSVLTPHGFSKSSDIDIAIGNCPLDRLDLYSQLSRLIQWPIDIVVIEKCNFKEHIFSQGERVC